MARYTLMMIFLLIVLAIPVCNLLWWWWADRRVRPLARARRWRALVAAFVLLQLAVFAALLLPRYVPVPALTFRPVVTVAYVWHMLVLPLSLIGLSIAGYHYLLEKTDLFAGVTTCQASAPCTVAWINWFGFVTIPFLSLIGFLTITLMTVIALNAGEPLEEEQAGESTGRSPWWPVVGVIALVVIAFGVLYASNRPTVTTSPGVAWPASRRA